VKTELLQQVEAAVRSGLTVSQIERKLGISNRNVRLAKAQLYKNGTLPRPTDTCPRKTYGNHNHNQ
jgi:predicted DNA-binding transcriptional regulator